MHLSESGAYAMREEIQFERDVSGYAKFAIAVMGMAAGVVVFAFSTFATKEQVKESVIDRLDRIESKVDKIYERGNE